MFKLFLLRHSNVILSRWIVLLIDLVLLELALIMANLLRFDFVLSELTNYHIRLQLFVLMLIGLVTIIATGSHRGLIRHTSQKDTLNIVKVVTITVLMLAVINYSLYYLGVNAYLQYIIKGVIIIMAVAIDVRKYISKK